ncbi:MAG: patatin-like phospholipase family protein [Bacteroidales bacterium]|nr:patatin-like phospholipase family protein [Bacteroidales bacterium]
MKRLAFILFLIATLPAWSQNAKYSDHTGRVVDAVTGKPILNVKVTHAIGGQSDENGRFTVRYYSTDSDLRVIVSHPGYCTDTFSIAPSFVSLRRMTAKYQNERPRVAVVLSGGGAKGVAHIGALKVIEEAGIPIDIICGTSMGALVGGLYALGYSPAELDSIVRAQDWTTMLSDRIDPDLLSLHQREEQNTYALIRGIASDRPQTGGLIRGRNLMALFHQLCDNRLSYFSPSGNPRDSIDFKLFPVRYACVATDLVTFNEVDFLSGNLLRVMRASMAIPGVFTPVRSNGMVLVDGGLTNNYPADLARSLGADIIIGVNVQNEPRTADEIGDAGSVMNQIIDMGARRKYEETMAISDVVIKVDVTGYSAASFTTAAIDTLLRRGEEEARRHMDELTTMANNKLSNRLPYTPPHNFSYPTLPTTNTPQHQSLPVVGIPIARVGFRFDSEDMGSLLLGGTLPLHTHVPIQLDAHLRLGRRFEASASATLFPRGFTSPTLSYSFRRNDLDIYSAGSRIYNVIYRQHKADFTPFNFTLRNYNIRIGLRWDLFDYFGRILTSFSDVPADIANLTDDNYFSYRIEADQNNENHWYFPSHGMRTGIRAAFITDNLVGLNGKEGLLDLGANWRINIPLSQRISLQPMLYGRILFSENPPVCYVNALGSEWFGQYVDQQMPFDGIHHTEYIDRHFAAFRLQGQYHMMKNHYFQLRLSAALTCDQWPTATSEITSILGTSAAYFYNTYFGPVGAVVGYNNLLRRPTFYITLGHRF